MTTARLCKYLGGAITLAALSACTMPNQTAHLNAHYRVHETAPDIILDSRDRMEANIARDQYRHPVETLNFFEFEANLTVVEIWPGKGWYTEVLAPSLHDKGTLYAAHFNPDSSIQFFKSSRQAFELKMQASADLYEHVKITSLEPPQALNIAPESSADRVYTFRNVHNWMRNEQTENVFRAFFKALKPGGILGVVEHRAPSDFSYAKMVESGYVTEAFVKDIAKKAGFEFVASSEMNANAKDTKDHPNGVWTLPPTLRIDADQKAHFKSIGESDRMTLKFRKPL